MQAFGHPGEHQCYRGIKKDRLRQQTVCGAAPAAERNEMNKHSLPREAHVSQVEKLLTYLQKNGSITGLECINNLGVLNYKARISDLRKLGWDIETTWVKKRSLDGVKITYARYVLKGEER